MFLARPPSLLFWHLSLIFPFFYWTLPLPATWFLIACYVMLDKKYLVTFASYKLPDTFYLILVTLCLLPDSCYEMFVFRCLLYDFWYQLPNTKFLPLVTRYLLPNILVTWYMLPFTLLFTSNCCQTPNLSSTQP